MAEYTVAEASRQVRKWTKVRNEAIRRDRAEGLSLRAIAAAAELSPQAIANITTPPRE